MELFTTIAAISTPPAKKGGVAIIRISGDKALDILSRVFVPRGKTTPGRDNPRQMIYGDIISGTERIDDGLAVYFPGPSSYTGEDMVEINCHGGVFITEAVLEAVLTAGAVMAEAGEFTRRAFMSGKLTLTDAEAIGLLLDAKHMGGVRLAGRRSRGVLDESLGKLRASLVELLASMYARIDYPDEDLGDFTDLECISALDGVRAEIQSLLATYRTGSAISLGVPTVIVGAANAGKSTLYNLLCGDEAAIVTDIAGTTRDVLEREIPVGNILLRLADTAGIRENTSDPIEKIGIERTIKRLEESSLAIALFDVTNKVTEEELRLIERLEALNTSKIALLTKCDAAVSPELIEKRLSQLKGHFDTVLVTSAKERGEELRRQITEAVEGLFIDSNINVGEDAIISTARQNSILLRAEASVANAISAFKAGYPQDIAASEIELALSAISELDGRAVSEEIVADIFKRFCVGK